MTNCKKCKDNKFVHLYNDLKQDMFSHNLTRINNNDTYIKSMKTDLENHEINLTVRPTEEPSEELEYIPKELLVHSCNIEVLKTIIDLLEDKAYLDVSHRLKRVALSYDDLINEYHQLKYK